MFVVPTYSMAVLFCVITMICWGSWANTQKLAQKSWRFELFYWDYVLGIVIASLLFAFTLGSFGTEGRGFVEDMAQASWSNVLAAFIGGVVFNLANILLIAAIAIAGMSVAFPVGIGIALVWGVITNYIKVPEGNVVLILAGVLLISVGIIVNAIAYRKLAAEQKKLSSKGLIIAFIAGVLMAQFYRFVVDGMTLNFSLPESGKLTPYTAIVIFAAGVFVSNFLFNTILMRRPVEGKPVSYGDYFNGRAGSHLTGVLGGIIWCMGMMFSIISAEKAGPAISYGLGQGAVLVAAFWGVFIWKEFKNAPHGTTRLLAVMFVCFVAGLGLIIYSKVAG